MGNGKEPNLSTVTSEFASFAGNAEAARSDLDLAVGDGLVDRGRRDDRAVQRDGEVLADVVAGVVREQLCADCGPLFLGTNVTVRPPVVWS